MKTCILLFSTCLLPAFAGILVTRPLWSVRRLTNEMIQGIALIVLIGVLSGCLALIFFGSESVIGGICILSGLFNLVIFQHYERRLNTSRCPWCRTRNLRAYKHGKIYKLYCPHCGLHSRWRAWRYFSNEI